MMAEECRRRGAHTITYASVMYLEHTAVGGGTSDGSSEYY